MRPELLEELEEAIESTGFSAARDLIVGQAVECLQLVDYDEDDYSVPGRTRFGGDPDLPDKIEWPRNGDRYCNFLAQINFADLPTFAGPKLPVSGLLYLFIREMDSAAEPVLIDTVYYEGDADKLSRRESPPDEEMADEYIVGLTAQTIVAFPSVSLPFYRRDFIKSLEDILGRDKGETWYEVADALDRGGLAQIGGFANAGDIRENLYRQVHLHRINRSRLIDNDYWDSMEQYEEYMQKYRELGEDRLVDEYESMRPGVTWLTENAEPITKEVAQWKLLLQVYSNQAMNFSVMDADPVYFFIREADLARKDFSDMASQVTQG